LLLYDHGEVPYNRVTSTGHVRTVSGGLLPFLI
jgi:hypothetical protein